MRFSQEFIERVSESSNLVDIISQYTQLKPTGSGLMGRCPFPDHPEKTASFSVSESKQVYHCFGCHKKGNIFTFLQHYNGMSFPEAIEYLADRAGIALPAGDSFSSKTEDFWKQKKQEIKRLNSEALKYFSMQLKQTKETHAVKSYLLKRGLSQEAIDVFQLGYATPDWDGLEAHFRKKKFNLELAEEAKLIKSRPSSKSGYYDIFRDRLIFPIFSASQEVLAFGGRIIQSGEPKYLNSPETPVFIKGRVLYGLSHTASFIRAEDQAILVEGYMDLISLYQSGIKNVVATMGTALTLDQCKLIRRITKNVVVLFDGDQAGQEAAEKSLPVLMEADLLPKGLVLENNLDPDDFIKQHGVEPLKVKISQAQDLFNLILQDWMVSYSGEASEKIKLCDRLKLIFKSIPDSRLAELYMDTVAEKMRVTKNWLKSAFVDQKLESVSLERQPQEEILTLNPAIEKPVKYSLKGARRSELLLMSLAIKTRANIQLLIKNRWNEEIQHAGVSQILLKAVDVYRHDPIRFDKLLSLLVSEVDYPDGLFVESLLGLDKQSGYIKSSETKNGVNVDVIDSQMEQKLMFDCYKKIKNESIKQQVKQLSKQLESEYKPETLEQIMNIQRSRYSLDKGE